MDRQKLQNSRTSYPGSPVPGAQGSQPDTPFSQQSVVLHDAYNDIAAKNAQFRKMQTVAVNRLTKIFERHLSISEEKEENSQKKSKKQNKLVNINHYQINERPINYTGECITPPPNFVPEFSISRYLPDISPPSVSLENTSLLRLYIEYNPHYPVSDIHK